MNILIIEDEMLAYKRLSKLINEILPDAVVLEPLECLESARQWFAGNPAPFLTFCDIHLSDGSALELLQEKVISSPVIITTAYDQYALQTFNTDAIAYLLKPVRRQPLIDAIEKANRLGSMLYTANETSEPVITVNEPAVYKSRFMIRFAEHLKVLMVDDVAYFYTENKGTYAKTFANKTFPMDQNLDTIEASLDPKRFFRLNRQFLINVNAIGEMRTYTKARVIVQLVPPVKDAPMVSSERAAEFKQWLADEM